MNKIIAIIILATAVASQSVAHSEVDEFETQIQLINEYLEEIIFPDEFKIYVIEEN